MPAQDYHQEPIYAYTGSAAQSFGGGFDRPWGAPGGMRRSSTLPNMSVHSRRGEQSHSRTLNPLQLDSSKELHMGEGSQSRTGFSSSSTRFPVYLSNRRG
jgi:hypothetical protein